MQLVAACLVIIAAIAGSAQAAIHSFDYRGADVFVTEWGYAERLNGRVVLDSDILGRPLKNTTVSWSCERSGSYPYAPEEGCVGDYAAALDYDFIGGFFGSIDYIASFQMTFDGLGRISDWLLVSWDDPHEYIATSAGDLLRNVGNYSDNVFTDYWSDRPGVWYSGSRTAVAQLSSAPLPAGLPLSLAGLGALALLRQRAARSRR